MSTPQYVDVVWDPKTGEAEIKIEGYADAVCDEIAKKVIAELGLAGAKVTKNCLTRRRRWPNPNPIHKMKTHLTR